MVSSRLKQALCLFVVCSLTLLSLACSARELDSSRDVSFADPNKKSQAKTEKVTAIELQQDLQRFASTFMARMYLVFQPPIEKTSPELFHTMQSEGLFYASTALDLAAGPNPEANLLDMMAFITLTRQSLEEHWIPKIYGRAGKDALSAFKKSEVEIWEIAERVSTEEQRRSYMEILQEWKQENPGLQRTETVRLTGIYRLSGQAGNDRGKRYSGILGQIESVVASTDQAVLLSNRAMFLAQRAPFLLRLHAKIGAREIVSETLKELARSDQLVKGVKGINPLVKDLTVLSSNSEQSLMRLESIVQELTVEKLAAMDRIMTKTNLTVETILGSKTQTSTNLISEISWKIERLIYIFLISMLVIISFWWLGYAWAKKKTRVHHD